MSKNTVDKLASDLSYEEFFKKYINKGENDEN
jgi:hypothetical protein